MAELHPSARPGRRGARAAGALRPRTARAQAGVLRADADTMIDAGTGRLRPARRLPQLAGTGDPPGTEALTAPRILLIFIVALLLPASFSLGGLTMPLYRIVLIALIVPLTLRWLNDKAHPVNAVDCLVIGYIVWAGLAIYVNHGGGRIVFIGSTILDQFGAYLVGRTLIRHAADHRLFFKYVFGALLILLPFALLEMTTRLSPIHDLVGLFATPGSRHGGAARLGFFRAHTVFPHPILFGIFCSLALANLFYVYRGQVVKRWTGMFLATFMTATSLSSAPLIGVGLQLAAIAWDYLSRILPGRWVLIALVAGLALLVVELAAPGGVLGLLLDRLAFSTISSWARLEVFEYGAAEVLRNPFFGIGFNDWVRPFWRKDSVDNFFLVVAMRHGIPALVLLLGAVLLHLLLVALSTYRATAHVDYRIGYLISWTALIFMMASVFIWGALSVFILTFLGAGAWFYSGLRSRPAPLRRPAP
jgi:hypothetical protein